MCPSLVGIRSVKSNEIRRREKEKLTLVKHKSFGIAMQWANKGSPVIPKDRMGRCWLPVYR